MANTIKDIIGGMLILIAAYLLLKDGGKTSAVINAIGGGVQEVTTSLQGGR